MAASNKKNFLSPWQLVRCNSRSFFFDAGEKGIARVRQFKTGAPCLVRHGTVGDYCNFELLQFAVFFPPLALPPSLRDVSIETNRFLRILGGPEDWRHLYPPVGFQSLFIGFKVVDQPNECTAEACFEVLTNCWKRKALRVSSYSNLRVNNFLVKRHFALFDKSWLEKAIKRRALSLKFQFNFHNKTQLKCSLKVTQFEASSRVSYEP